MIPVKVRIADAVRQVPGGLSQKEIAGVTGIPWGTMHKAVAELLKSDILLSGDCRNRTPGRPAIPLRLNGEAWLCCGIDLGAGHTRVVFTDLNFRLLSKRVFDTEYYTTRERFIVWLAEVFEKALADSGLARNRLCGIGLGISGNVDAEKNLVASGGNFGMKMGENIDLAEFSKAVKLPVTAVSGQAASVLAEYHFGRRAGAPNLVTIGLGIGIGSGVIANHQLLISHPRRPVGYIGHILIPGNRHRCSCGFTGCLEAYSGGNFLKKVAAEALPESPELHDAAALDRAAASGNPAAREIMRTAANYNAAGVAAMLQLYTPDALIFGGGQVREDGFLYRETLASLREILPEERRDSCEIFITTLGELQAALGAARFAFEHFF